MWAIMKAYKFQSLLADGKELSPPPEGPQRFIPVFDTYEQAENFKGGSDGLIVELQEI